MSDSKWNRAWQEQIRGQLDKLRLTPTREAEIVEELSQHADDRYRELIQGGASEVDAARIALNEITANERLSRGLTAIEHTHVPDFVLVGAERRRALFGGLDHDIRFALRKLRKNPGFTAIVILVLALGIGANTAIFSVVNGVLMRPLNYPSPDRLLEVFETTPDLGQMSVAYPNYVDWRREAKSFSGMGAYRGGDFNFTGAGEPEQISGLYVSASLFPVLGVSPMLGRNFLPEEDRPGAACSALLSYGFWRQRLGGSADILGRSLTLNAKRCTVIGVMPSNFRFRDEAHLYLPLEQADGVQLHSREIHPGIRVAARLRAGVTARQAQAEISTICSRLAAQFPSTNASHSAKVIGLKENLVQAIRPTLLLLLGAVGFVLLIACANVANLLLARSAARKREFAIRVALGAERWRVVRQLLTESIILSTAAGVAGLVLARWGARVIMAAAPGSLPRSGEIGTDWSVLAFTFLLSLATGVLFGLAPAFYSSRADPQGSLKEGTRGAGGGRHRLEGLFVALEVGLAVVLLVGAGLMLQSVWLLLRVNPGFNVHNILTMQVALSPRVMATPEGIRLAYQQLLTRVAAVPGVQSAAMTALVPLDDNDNEIPFWPGTGPQPPQDRLTPAVLYVVTPQFARVLQIPLHRGRFLSEQDTAKSPRVVVIDDVMARRFFPRQDPIGKQISLILLGPVRVVGVVGHVKQFGLDSDDTNKVRDQIYFPIPQIPDALISQGVAGVTLALRTADDPLSMASAVRAQVAGPTRDQPVYAVRTMEEIVARSLAERRFTMLLLAFFATSALLLAAVGIYGVMSYAVTRRLHELGIRAALGAPRRQILGLVLGQGMRLAAIGMAAGLIAAWALTRLLTNLLYGVRPADPLTFVSVAVLLSAIALLACYVPARRATAVDPVIALRCE